MARPSCRATHFPALPSPSSSSSSSSSLSAATEAAAAVLEAASKTRGRYRRHANASVSTEYVCSEKRPLLVAPGCDAGYWGVQGPCCKAAYAFRHLAVHRANLLANSSSSSTSKASPPLSSLQSRRLDHDDDPAATASSGGGGIRWFVFADDDSYFVPSPLRRYLEG